MIAYEHVAGETLYFTLLLQLQKYTPLSFNKHNRKHFFETTVKSNDRSIHKSSQKENESNFHQKDDWQLLSPLIWGIWNTAPDKMNLLEYYQPQNTSVRVCLVLLNSVL